jgi:hypothetical protein
MLGQPLIGMYGNFFCGQRTIVMEYVFLEMSHTSHSQEGGEIP